MKTPYLSFVDSYAKVLDQASKIPLGDIEPLNLPALSADAPVVLLFSPHPDDEGITGALPLRLRRENNYRIINVAVTQGSNKDRQAGRWAELQNACQYLGFETIQTTQNGLEKVTPFSRQDDPKAWAQKVSCIADIITKYEPQIVVCPHESDWNGSHIGTHYLVTDALEKANYDGTLIETEFWGAMDDPNLMIESSNQDVADLVSSISFHIEEVERNPYHITLPSWMSDNVRRGGELVGGQGGAAPDFTFATLYRISNCADGSVISPLDGGINCSKTDDLIEKLF